MMQHIAALKSELTAKLPIEDFKINTGFVNEDAGLRQSFEQRSAFEDAMEQARQRHDSKSNDQNQSDVVRDKHYNEARQREQAETQETRQREQQRSIQDRQARQQEQLRAEQREKVNEDNQARMAEQRERSESNEKINRADVSDDSSVKASNGSGTEKHEDDSSKRLDNADNEQVSDMATSNESSEEFDWVEYVNQVRLLDAKDELVVDIEKLDELSLGKDLFAQFIQDQQIESKQIKDGKDIELANIEDKLSIDTEQEFVSVHLSQEELSAIFEQEGINLDADTALDSDKLAALDKAVAKILERFVSEDSNTNNQATDSLDAEKLDADLLKTLLAKSSQTDEAQISDLDVQVKSDIASDINSKQSQSGITTSEFVQEAAVEPDEQLVSEQVSDNTTQATNASANQLAEKVTKDTPDVQNDEAKQQEVAKVVGLQVGQASDLVDDAPIPISVSPDLKADKVIDLPKKTPNSKGLEILTKLSDDKLEGALENITKRVSEVVSELKGDAKSTEFIAALQAGVKEVKEQLKQGREPGIDLKALVSDALVKVEVNSVQPQTEAKLERQVTQVANILGVASSLSQATTQAVSATIGLNEVNLQKEVNQAQVENAKQLNQQTSSDKAYNILKPDGQTQLAEKVRWMVNNRSLTADIRLDPPDLGGMQIKVAMSGDAASVNFIVQSQHARDVLDQAVPQLREMLEEQGISLGESSVQQESSNGQQELADNRNLGTGGANSTNDDSNESQNNDLADQNVHSEQRVVNGRIGGIDYYA